MGTLCILDSETSKQPSESFTKSIMCPTLQPCQCREQSWRSLFNNELSSSYLKIYKALEGHGSHKRHDYLKGEEREDLKSLKWKSIPGTVDVGISDISRGGEVTFTNFII